MNIVMIAMMVMISIAKVYDGDDQDDIHVICCRKKEFSILG